MENNYREILYKDYAISLNNGTGSFDYDSVKKWAPCLKYYLNGWFPTDKNANIIDLGCGNGRMIYLFHQLGYKNIDGVDISESQIKIAQQISDRVFEADVINFLKNASKKYDLILAFDLIEHLQKNEALELLALTIKNLNKNGRLILQTPNACSPFFGSIRYGDFTHEIAFTPDLLSKLVRRVGFSHVIFRETGPVAFTYSHKSTIRYFLWQFFKLFFASIETIETGGNSHRIYTRNFLLSAVNKNG